MRWSPKPMPPNVSSGASGAIRRSIGMPPSGLSGSTASPGRWPSTIALGAGEVPPEQPPRGFRSCDVRVASARNSASAPTATSPVEHRLAEAGEVAGARVERGDGPPARQDVAVTVEPPRVGHAERTEDQLVAQLLGGLPRQLCECLLHEVVGVVVVGPDPPGVGLERQILVEAGGHRHHVAQGDGVLLRGGGLRSSHGPTRWSSAGRCRSRPARPARRSPGRPRSSGSTRRRQRRSDRCRRSTVRSPAPRRPTPTVARSRAPRTTPRVRPCRSRRRHASPRRRRTSARSAVRSSTFAASNIVYGSPR